MTDSTCRITSPWETQSIWTYATCPLPMRIIPRSGPVMAASPSPNAWVLNTPVAWKVHQPFNLSRFKRDTSDTTRTPVMVHTARGSEYMIDQIVAREKQGNRWMYVCTYKIRWTRQEEQDDTLSNLDGCKETVEEFHKERGLTPARWPKRKRRRR
jgi:hypothetical protein